jgi:phage tail-like protein
MSARRRDPAPSFRFRVEFADGPSLAPAHFTECGGLELTADTYDYREGGEWARVHRLPGVFKAANLELKRGITADGEGLWQWVLDAARGIVRPAVVTVHLLHEDRTEARRWTFFGAFPVKWSASPLTAQSSGVAIETLTLAHQGLVFGV